jgi:hypothetical protein
MEDETEVQLTFVADLNEIASCRFRVTLPPSGVSIEGRYEGAGMVRRIRMGTKPIDRNARSDKHLTV